MADHHYGGAWKNLGARGLLEAKKDLANYSDQMAGQSPGALVISEGRLTAK